VSTPESWTRAVLRLDRAPAGGRETRPLMGCRARRSWREHSFIRADILPGMQRGYFYGRAPVYPKWTVGRSGDHRRTSMSWPPPAGLAGGTAPSTLVPPVPEWRTRRVAPAGAGHPRRAPAPRSTSGRGAHQPVSGTATLAGPSPRFGSRTVCTPRATLARCGQSVQTLIPALRR